MVAAFIWGVAFIAQKEAEDLIPPVTFVAARFGISALALAPLAAPLSRPRGWPISPPRSGR